MDWGWFLFGFQGRINRAKYWLAVLIYVVISLIVSAIGLAIGRNLGWGIVTIIINIGVFISGLAVGSKRLHDREKSAWWVLVFYVAPAVLYAIGVASVFASHTTNLLLLCGALALAIGIWALVELGCLRGTPGPNAYGADPLGTV